MSVHSGINTTANWRFQIPPLFSVLFFLHNVTSRCKVVYFSLTQVQRPALWPVTLQKVLLLFLSVYSPDFRVRLLPAKVGNSQPLHEHYFSCWLMLLQSAFRCSYSTHIFTFTFITLRFRSETIYGSRSIWFHIIKIHIPALSIFFYHFTLNCNGLCKPFLWTYEFWVW